MSKKDTEAKLNAIKSVESIIKNNNLDPENTTFDDVVFASREVFILERKIELVKKIVDGLKQSIVGDGKIYAVRDGKPIESPMWKHYDARKVSLERLLAGAEVLIAKYQHDLNVKLAELHAGYIMSESPTDEITRTDRRVLSAYRGELNKALEVSKRANIKIGSKTDREGFKISDYQDVEAVMVSSVIQFDFANDNPDYVPNVIYELVGLQMELDRKITTLKRKLSVHGDSVEVRRFDTEAELDWLLSERDRSVDEAMKQRGQGREM